MASFSDSVRAFRKTYEARLRSVGRDSVQEIISMAQTTRGEGGAMRVKTGFLRASIQAAIDKVPSGPVKGEKGEVYAVGTQAAGEPVSATLLRWDPNTGATLFVGWTANYARAREAHDGFLRSAAQMWDKIVENSAKKARQEIG